ncbi:MAG: D52 family tumor protein, partial [Polaromonas sp.]|nr:D52 family tumor protein [Polaromonas sp.]
MKKYRGNRSLAILTCTSLAVTATGVYAQGAPATGDDAGVRIEQLQQQLTEQNQQIQTLRQAVADQEARHRELQRALGQESRPVAGQEGSV